MIVKLMFVILGFALIALGGLQVLSLEMNLFIVLGPIIAGSILLLYGLGMSS